jgi:hypothetical protein
MYRDGREANMAEYPMDERFGAADDAHVGSLAGWFGALISLFLLVGITVWGYQMVMRDVNGIPVVRAAQDPMRIAPLDPGGTPAENQGLSVNAVAGENSSAALADRVVLAPRPFGLTAEDTSINQLQDASLKAERNGAVVNVLSKSIQDLVAQIASANEPLNPLGGALREASPLVAIELLPKSLSGLRRSLRPKLRPGWFQTASLAQNTAAARAVVDVDPASLARDTPLVQLGAFQSAAIAKSEWGNISGRFGPIFNAKNRVIERATSGGKVFYRLRASGFADRDATRRFCSALKAENTKCITVVSK